MEPFVWGAVAVLSFIRAGIAADDFEEGRAAILVLAGIFAAGAALATAVGW